MNIIEQEIAPEDAVGESEVSFTEAAERAAEDAARKGWEKRAWKNKPVVLQVDLTITNPGHIDQYRVIIKK